MTRKPIAILSASRLPAPVVSAEGRAVLPGVAVATVGPMLGHGMFMDAKSLSQMAALAAMNPKGVKSRYGHPQACSDTLGSNIGRMRGFAIVGDKLTADLHLADYAASSHRGDLRKHILDVATEDPEIAGFSVYLWEWSAVEIIKASTGMGSVEVEVDPMAEDFDPSAHGPLFLRAKSLDFVDFVAEPAANPGGMFAGTPAELPAQFSLALNKFFDRPDAYERAVEFLDRWRPAGASRLSERGSSVPPSTNREESRMSTDTKDPVVDEARKALELATNRITALELELGEARLATAIAASGFTPDQISALQLSGDPAQKALQLATAARALQFAPVKLSVGSTPALAVGQPGGIVYTADEAKRAAEGGR